MSYLEKWTQNLDLEKNGLSHMVDGNIRRYRTSSARISVKDSDGKPVEGAHIKVEQVSHAFRFGCNAFMAGGFETPEKNAEYEKLFGRVFNQAVIPFYWRDDEPEPGKWRFEKDSPFIYRRPPAESMLEFCARTKTEPKGHNLVWQNPSVGLPEWWPEDKRVCQNLIDHRIRLIASRYADRIPVWDVTNEVIGADGIEKMPRDFDVKAFRLASELFPGNHLILNDFACYFDGKYHAESTALYQQALRIAEAGGRIDGIGMQFHLFVEKEKLEHRTDRMLNAEYMLRMLMVYSQLNHTIHVSEVTVPSYDGAPEFLEAQAKMVESLYKLWFSMEKVGSIVWWNLIDGYAFIDPKNPSWNENSFGGGLLKKNFSPKPAFDTVERLINREWKTRVSGETDCGGNFEFRGFHGTYRVTVGKSGASSEHIMELKKSSPFITIRLK